MDSLNKLVAILFLVNISTSQTYSVTSGKMLIEARSSVLGVEAEFDAIGNGVSGELSLDSNKVSFVYDLWQIDTGIELRNDHMHDNYLETETYPKATYNGVIVTVYGENIHTEGILSLHGVEKKVSISGRLVNGVLTAIWSIKLTDFNIEIPRQFIFAKLSEKLVIKITCVLKAEDLK